MPKLEEASVSGLASKSSRVQERRIGPNQKSKKLFCVLQGTDTIFNKLHHYGEPIEYITKSALRSRRKVLVVKGTAEKFEARRDAGKPSEEISLEEISLSAFFHRCSNMVKVRVLQGTAIRYEESAHAGKPYDEISRATQLKRQKVCVLQGTCTRYREGDHDGKPYEKISRTCFYSRRRKKSKAKEEIGAKKRKAKQEIGAKKRKAKEEIGAKNRKAKEEIGAKKKALKGGYPDTMINAATILCAFATKASTLCREEKAAHGKFAPNCGLR